MTILVNASQFIPTLGSDEETNNNPWRDTHAFPWPTLTGGAVACHASVIDMLTEHGLTTWGGYRYFCAWTTDGINFYENPYLSVSNDSPGISQAWITRGQYVNKSGMDGNGASDPEILYDPNLDKIILFYNQDGTGMYRIVVHSDFTADAEQLVYPIADFESPTIVPGAVAGTYHMYYVKGSVFQIMHSISTDYGVTWGAEQECAADAIQSAYSGYKPWHLEARLSPISGQIEMVIASMIPDGGYAGIILVHAQSRLNDPTTLLTPLAPSIILQPSGSGWDNLGLYRSSFVLSQGSGNININLYYDAFGTDQWDRIGFTSGVLGTIAQLTIALPEPSALARKSLGNTLNRGRFGR